MLKWIPYNWTKKEEEAGSCIGGGCSCANQWLSKGIEMLLVPWTKYVEYQLCTLLKSAWWNALNLWQCHQICILRLNLEFWFTQASSIIINELYYPYNLLVISPFTEPIPEDHTNILHVQKPTQFSPGRRAFQAHNHDSYKWNSTKSPRAIHWMHISRSMSDNEMVGLMGVRLNCVRSYQSFYYSALV